MSVGAVVVIRVGFCADVSVRATAGPENIFGKRRRRVAVRDPNPIGGPIVRIPVL